MSAIDVMVQPHSRQIGEAGETYVKLFFERLGWGPIEVPTPHDLGTDLLVSIRDQERRETGYLLGVQVKTHDELHSTAIGGKSFWKHTESDQRHRNYWLNHKVPHILIVQSADSRQSGWTILDEQTMKPTGKGFRVDVPCDQPLSEKYADQWLDYAMSATKGSTRYEGAVWDFSIADQPEADWCRHALLMPRLVAPHPNKSLERPIVWPEAVALCLRAEAHRWASPFRREGNAAPTPEAAKSDRQWGWRFAAAVYYWTTEGSQELLTAAASSAKRWPQRIAASIIRSVALSAEFRLNEALELLRALKPSGRVSVIDRAWLNVHIGSLLVELGENEEGRKRFSSAAEFLSPVSGNDATVSAIRGAAIRSLFYTGDWRKRDVADVIPALDIPSDWWRAEARSGALAKAVERRFKTWAHDRSVILGGTDGSHNKLLAASWNAQLAGGFGAGNWEDALLGMVNLATDNKRVDHHMGALNSLLKAGDSKNLRLALTELMQSGPIGAVVSFVSGIDPSMVTRTTVRAVMESLSAAGSYCQDEQASAIIEYLIDRLVECESFDQRFLLQGNARQLLLDAITGFSENLTQEQEGRVLTMLIAQMIVDQDQLLRRPITKFIGHLSPEIVKAHAENALQGAAQMPKDSWVYWCLLGLAAHSMPEARQQLGEALKQANFAALEALGQYDRLTRDEAHAFVEACQCHLDSIRGEATSGVYSYNSWDYAVAYFHAARQLDDDSLWIPLIDFIEEENVYGTRKTGVLQAIGQDPQFVPPLFRERLLSACRDLPGTVMASDPLLGDSSSPNSAAALLVLELLPEKSEEARTLLFELLRGDASQRESAARFIVRAPAYVELLLPLVNDSSPEVSGQAVKSLAAIAAGSDCPQSWTIDTVKSALTGDDPRLSRSAVQGLHSVEEPCSAVEPLVLLLADHPNAQARHVMRIIQERWGKH
ncbi:MAG: DUF4365 domain-containing protein [Propionibacteriaceae bacterium]|jgi:hypothetical protein|nr:DUF4365 domain-containing protein [Propionibacteriaceae bacterium]